MIKESYYYYYYSCRRGTRAMRSQTHVDPSRSQQLRPSAKTVHRRNIYGNINLSCLLLRTQLLGNTSFNQKCLTWLQWQNYYEVHEGAVESQHCFYHSQGIITSTRSLNLSPWLTDITAPGFSVAGPMAWNSLPDFCPGSQQQHRMF